MNKKQIALLDFIDKIEQVGQFQDKIDISSTINHIWDTFVEELRNFINIDACALFWVDDQTHEFVLRSACPDKNGDVFRQEVEYQIECDMFSWIINRRIPALIPSFVFKDQKSIIMLPLSTLKRTLGVVSVLTSITENMITQESLKLLTMLARQCSLVMENSILYNKLKTKHQALERARDQIISSEKMASIGRLTAGASHEILNPLTIISGQIQLMKLKSELNADALNSLNIVNSQTNRIAGIINGLAQFSQNNCLQKEKIDINALVDEFIQSARQELDALDIKLLKKCTPSLPKISGNRKMLMKVLSYLLSNAMDAMPEGGIVNISIQEENGRIASETENDCIKISFIDTGIGIEHKNLGKVMDPFFTTKYSTNRTGLGLSLCYGIIQDHDGTITVSSNPGTGTEVLIYLPV